MDDDKTVAVVLDHLSAARHWANCTKAAPNPKTALALIGECEAARLAAEQLHAEIENARQRSVAEFVARMKGGRSTQPTEDQP